jgi:hypothetical protein
MDFWVAGDLVGDLHLNIELKVGGSSGEDCGLEKVVLEGTVGLCHWSRISDFSFNWSTLIKSACPHTCAGQKDKGCDNSTMQ